MGKGSFACPSGSGEDGDSGFGVEGFEFGVWGEVELFVGLADFVAEFGAAAVEFDAVGFGVGEDGDEASWPGEETVDGPGGEGVGFAGLTGPEPDFEAGCAVEGGLLIWAEGEER